MLKWGLSGRRSNLLKSRRLLMSTIPPGGKCVFLSFLPIPTPGTTTIPVLHLHQKMRDCSFGPGETNCGQFESLKVILFTLVTWLSPCPSQPVPTRVRNTPGSATVVRVPRPAPFQFGELFTELCVWNNTTFFVLYLCAPQTLNMCHAGEHLPTSVFLTK